MSRRARATVSLELLEQVADEAARLMAEHGVGDFALAKRKAAERLGVSARGVLPSNAQIQERIMARQRLFEPNEHAALLSRLRRIAADVMQTLEEFRPRLVGAVLDGSATISTAIELHVFSDAPELVAAALESTGRRLRDSQRRYRLRPDADARIPGFDLEFEDEEVRVMVFPERGSHHAPHSPIDGRPMRRASRASVMALLEEGTDA
jgi:hypothetical protein